jgi:hypothetical protein
MLRKTVWMCGVLYGKPGVSEGRRKYREKRQGHRSVRPPLREGGGRATGILFFGPYWFVFSMLMPMGQTRLEFSLSRLVFKPWAFCSFRRAFA